MHGTLDQKDVVLDGTVFWLAACCAAIFVGLGKGGVPIVSALAVPTLALTISPIAAVGLLLPVFIAADVFGLIAYRKMFDWSVLRIMLVAMPLGVLIGYLTIDVVSDAQMKLILGLIGFVFSISLMPRRKREAPPQTPRWRPGLFWGAIAGFTSFISHSGAVPYQVYVRPLGLTKLAFAGTTTAAFAVTNMIKLVPYYALGQLNFSNLKTAAILMLPAVLAVFMGVKLIKVIPEKMFFQLITWALLLLSVKLLWDGYHQL